MFLLWPQSSCFAPPQEKKSLCKALLAALALGMLGSMDETRGSAMVVQAKVL